MPKSKLPTILALISFSLFLSPAGALVRADAVGAVYLYAIAGPFRSQRFDRNAVLFLERTRRELYVLDRHHVYIFNANGNMEFDFALTKHKSKHGPISIVADDKGNIYILQYKRDVQFIEMFDFRGDYLGRLELKGYPQGKSQRVFNRLDLDPKMRLYVTDMAGMDILIFNLLGEYLSQISDEQGEFAERDRASRFDDIDFDKKGFTYLLDWGMDKIFIYDQDMKFVLSFGERGGVRGKFSQPLSLAADRLGKELIYVADTTMHVVGVFTTKGKYVGEVGGFGSGPGQFYFPKQVVTDDNGQLYVLDLYHGIQAFDVSDVHRIVQDDAPPRPQK